MTRHWLATIGGAGYTAVVWTAEDAADYRAQGWTVKGPFVPAEESDSGNGFCEKCGTTECWNADHPKQPC